MSATSGVLILGLLAVGCGGSKTDSAARAGATPAPTLKLVAIGDSLPFGHQDCGGCRTFPELYGEAIGRQTGATVDTENLSEHIGLTSDGLRREILGSDPFRRSIARADIITVTIGHNDTPWNRTDDSCDGDNPFPPRDWGPYDSACVHKTAREYGRNLDRILTEIDALRGGKPTAVRVTDDYNDVIGDPHIGDAAGAAALRASRGVVGAYSTLTCRIAQRHHAVCVDTYHRFNGDRGVRDAAELLAEDHTHPNPMGHRVIAGLLARTGVSPLAGPRSLATSPP
jgi:lysophospholipase L1-like esterase